MLEGSKKYMLFVQYGIAWKYVGIVSSVDKLYRDMMSYGINKPLHNTG